MPIQNKNIDFKRKTLFVPVRAFSGTPTGTGVVANDPVIASTGYAGTKWGNADNAHQHFMRIPNDLDPSRDIGLRVIWTSAAAAVGTRTITWLAKYNVVANGGAPVAPATALDTAITAQAPKGTANAMEKGNRGIVKAATLADTAEYIGIEISRSAIAAAFTEAHWLLGMELDYAVQPTLGQRSLSDPVSAANHLGVTA